MAESFGKGKVSSEKKNNSSLWDSFREKLNKVTGDSSSLQDQPLQRQLDEQPPVSNEVESLRIKAQQAENMENELHQLRAEFTKLQQKCEIDLQNYTVLKEDNDAIKVKLRESIEEVERLQTENEKLLAEAQISTNPKVEALQQELVDTNPVIQTLKEQISQGTQTSGSSRDSSSLNQTTEANTQQLSGSPDGLQAKYNKKKLQYKECCEKLTEWKVKCGKLEQQIKHLCENPPRRMRSDQDLDVYGDKGENCDYYSKGNMKVYGEGTDKEMMRSMSVPSSQLPKLSTPLSSTRPASVPSDYSLSRFENEAPLPPHSDTQFMRSDLFGSGERVNPIPQATTTTAVILPAPPLPQPHRFCVPRMAAAVESEAEAVQSETEAVEPSAPLQTDVQSNVLSTHIDTVSDLEGDLLENSDEEQSSSAGSNHQ